MNGSSVETPVGFADGELLGYEHADAKLIVIVRAWNEQKLRIEFSDVIGLEDLGAGDISDLQRSHDSQFMQKCLDRVYESAAPENHPYSSFVFLNNDDEPSLEVIAEKVSILT